MNITITKAVQANTPTLRQLYELYCHDFSEFTGSDVGFDGRYTDDQFMADLWQLDYFDAWLTRVDGRLAGFAWVMRGRSVFTPDAMPFPHDTHNWIDEFFVMRKYRRQGVGRHVAHTLFDTYAGIWELGEMNENTPAQAFWRRIIGDYTAGAYSEYRMDNESWRGPVQVFRSKA